LEYSESTRHALVDSAVDLFTKRGYAATSLDEVAKRARVTKARCTTISAASRPSSKRRSTRWRAA